MGAKKRQGGPCGKGQEFAILYVGSRIYKEEPAEMNVRNPRSKENASEERSAGRRGEWGAWGKREGGFFGGGAEKRGSRKSRARGEEKRGEPGLRGDRDKILQILGVIEGGSAFPSTPRASTRMLQTSDRRRKGHL